MLNANNNNNNNKINNKIKYNLFLLICRTKQFSPYKIIDRYQYNKNDITNRV